MDRAPTTSQDSGHGSIKTYVVGFGLSLVLTMTAYWCVVSHAISGTALLAIIIILAVTQLVVQLRFFLHLGKESKPRWNLTVFAFMALVLGIVVFGSLWIMHNLNYRMTPTQVDQYVTQDEGVHL